jgi:hypothetical protein
MAKPEDAVYSGTGGSLTTIVDRIAEISGEGSVSLERVIGAFEKAGFATLLFIPAAAVVTPLSGIPLFSSVCGLTICLIAMQWLLDRDRVWLPRWLRRRSLEGQKVRKAMMKLRPAARWLDRHSKKRVQFLFRQPLRLLLPLACLSFGAAMPLLEFVPFSSSLLGAAICLIAFSLMTRDGFYALAALAPVAVAGWLLVALL